MATSNKAINESYAELTVENTANGGWMVTGDTIEEDGSFAIRRYTATTPGELIGLLTDWAYKRTLRNAAFSACSPARGDALVE